MALAKINVNGNAGAHGFPTLRKIAESITPGLCIATHSKRRIDESLDGKQTGYLNGLLRRQMEFARGSWPKAIECPGIDHPVILHPGLTEKFAEKGDTGHIRFAAYAAEVIKKPMEVWAANEGRDLFHILGCLTVSTSVVYMNVVVEADSHICDTAYVVDRPGRIEAYRRDRPLFLAWGLKI